MDLLKAALTAELETLLTYLDKTCIPRKQFGCFAAVSQDKSTVFTCPMNADGSPDRDPDYPAHMNWLEVTAPRRAFVECVNVAFGTWFPADEFPGR